MLAEKAVPTDSADRAERDRSFLIFAGIVLVAISLGFKSELLNPGQVWALALGLVLIAAPALLGYLRGAEEFPRAAVHLEHRRFPVAGRGDGRRVDAGLGMGLDPRAVIERRVVGQGAERQIADGAYVLFEL